MSPRPRILIAEGTNFSPRAAAALREFADVQIEDLDRPALLNAVTDADGLWVRLRHRIDQEVMGAAPRLRYVASATTGLNHIDVHCAERRGIRVISLQGESGFLKQIHATAEHTIALMLAVLRRIPAAVEHTREGAWNRDWFRGGELHGKTLGIVGYGRVGQMVADLALAFGARVLSTDIRTSSDPFSPVLTVPVNELLEQSDIVSLHVNLCAHTAGFWGHRHFGRMKRSAYFINTARGELVDEGALLDALREGRIAGAALDVLSNETGAGMGHHPLVRYSRLHPNLLVTPHIAGCTAESMEQTEVFLAEKMAACLRHDQGQDAPARQGQDAPARPAASAPA